jgi:predicted NAD/FAD-dependent oxidoreductase
MTSVASSKNSYDIIIVGAGIAGMAAARELAPTGARILVIEKSRGIGGRCSLRRGQEWSADLGLQFVSKGSTLWDQFLAQQTERLRSLPILTAEENAEAMVHTDGMNALIKSILPSGYGNVDFCFSTRATEIVSFDDGKYIAIKSDPESEFRTLRLILTAPLHQSAALLSVAMIEPMPLAEIPLSQTTYSQCFSLVFKSTHSSFMLPAPLWTHCSDDIAGLFDQGAKGIPSGKGVYVAQTSFAFSSGQWEKTDAEIVSDIKSRLVELSHANKLGLTSIADLEILSFHRWRYCQCLTPIADALTQRLNVHDLAGTGQIILAGDCFGPKQLNSAARAFESGIHAARACVIA